MEQFKGAGYNAVGIEYSFAHILNKEIGARGGLNDADVFRIGSVKELGKLLEDTVKQLEDRCNKIRFTENETVDGGLKPRTFVPLKRLQELAIEMQKSKAKEADDYHWLIIGELVQIIDSVLRHYKV